MIDDILKDIRDHLANAEKRERAANERAKLANEVTWEGLQLVAGAIEQGFRVLVDTIRDERR